MPKFRKKPIVIEAEQYRQDRPVRGVCRCSSDECGSTPHVHTIHQGQAVRVQDGDWIIPEQDGEHYYPCKADTFAATYEPV